MRFSKYGLVALFFLTPFNGVSAAELVVLSSIGVQEAMQDLANKYEESSHHKVKLVFGTASALQRRISSGENFDLAILTPATLHVLTEQGKIVVGTETNIARSGMGLAIRAGAPRKPIRNTAELTSALLSARSIAYTRQGASGEQFLKLLDRLRITDQVVPRLVDATPVGGKAGELVASGKAELAVQLINEVQSVKGIELLGPFPPEVQHYTVFAAAISRTAQDALAAKGLLYYLSSPEAKSAFKAHGQEPIPEK